MKKTIFLVEYIEEFNHDNNLVKIKDCALLTKKGGMYYYES